MANNYSYDFTLYDHKGKEFHAFGKVVATDADIASNLIVHHYQIHYPGIMPGPVNLEDRGPHLIPAVSHGYFFDGQSIGAPDTKGASL